MKRLNRRNLFVLIIGLLAVAAISSLEVGRADDESDKQFLKGRIVAVGIPGASAISAVGQFLPGGPIHDKPALAAFTQPGQVLEPMRILVGSSSNFGETLARTDELPGSFLSIDSRGDTLVIPKE
jgi:hypothetical protein